VPAAPTGIGDVFSKQGGNNSAARTAKRTMEIKLTKFSGEIARDHERLSVIARISALPCGAAEIEFLDI